MILCKKANNKGADQTAQMRRLVCACVVPKPPKTGFLASRPKYERVCKFVTEIKKKYPVTNFPNVTRFFHLFQIYSHLAFVKKKIFGFMLWATSPTNNYKYRFELTRVHFKTLFIFIGWLTQLRCILKPTANWSLFKLIISDQTLMKLKWFFAYICAF